MNIFISQNLFQGVREGDMVYPNGAFRVTQYIVLDHARWCENNVSFSRIYTFVFSSCLKPTTRSNVFSAWLCKMFLSVSLPCPALIIATPSQPSIRLVRHFTFFLVHSFCNTFTVLALSSQTYFHILTCFHSIILSLSQLYD